MYQFLMKTFKKVPTGHSVHVSVYKPSCSYAFHEVSVRNACAMFKNWRYDTSRKPCSPNGSSSFIMYYVLQEHMYPCYPLVYDDGEVEGIVYEERGPDVIMQGDHKGDFDE